MVRRRPGRAPSPLSPCALLGTWRAAVLGRLLTVSGVYRRSPPRAGLPRAQVPDRQTAGPAQCPLYHSMKPYSRTSTTGRNATSVWPAITSGTSIRRAHLRQLTDIRSNHLIAGPYDHSDRPYARPVAMPALPEDHCRGRSGPIASLVTVVHLSPLLENLVIASASTP